MATSIRVGGTLVLGTVWSLVCGLSSKLNDADHCERGDKWGKKRWISHISVDSDAKFARERYIRVAAMDIMIIEGT